jgi:hypothetical protein
MEQLSLIPVCEVHGELKVWVRNKAQKAGGQWKCRRCQKILHDQWKARPGNQEKYDEQRQAWACVNGGKVKETRVRRMADPKVRAAENERCRAKRKRDNARYTALASRRRVRKVAAAVCLDRLDESILTAIYQKAAKTGFTVDHIQPLSLQGDHAPWNLQLLTLSQNSAKRNSRPTLKEVLRGERRYRLLRFMYEQRASSVGAAT